jgi:GTP cyclohydrolase II
LESVQNGDETVKDRILRGCQSGITEVDRRRFIDFWSPTSCASINSDRGPSKAECQEDCQTVNVVEGTRPALVVAEYPSAVDRASANSCDADNAVSISSSLPPHRQPQRVGDEEPVLVRIHSACFTGETLFSTRCDCGEQLEDAMLRMSQRGHGILIYLGQEGRGIGLEDKLKYALHLRIQYHFIIIC